jgi:hypothetical protein
MTSNSTLSYLGLSLAVHSWLPAAAAVVGTAPAPEPARCLFPAPWLPRMTAPAVPHQGAPRLAPGGLEELEKPRLDARLNWPVLRCPWLAGFGVSTEGQPGDGLRIAAERTRRIKSWASRLLVSRNAMNAWHRAHDMNSQCAHHEEDERRGPQVEASRSRGTGEAEPGGHRTRG